MPGPASTDSLPASTRTRPSATTSSAASFTWWSPSSWPACRWIATTRDSPSCEWRTRGDREPSGVVIAVRSQCCTTGTYPRIPLITLALVAIAVDTYPLGPIQTNCYVVRSERGAPEAAVVDPGADAATLRLELAGMGATCAAILITHG